MRYLVFLLLLIGSTASAQLTYYIRSDTVKIMKQGGNNELYIQNGSRAVKGVLVNTGNGLTRFIASRTSGDTLFVGLDTLIGIGAAGWKLTGNTGINDVINFIGTTDDESLRFKTNGVNSGLVGNRGSTFFGYGTGTGADSTGGHDSTGHRNTTYGYMAGNDFKAGGGASVAIGFEVAKSGYMNTDVFIGFRTGKYAGSSSFRNVMIGVNAGYFVNNTRNTGVGVFNWENLRNGTSNTGIGEGAGRYAVDGNGNTALGATANHNSTTWIDTIVVTGVGSGYTSDPTVVISAPCDATFGWPFGTDQATATAIRTGNTVTSVVMTSRGGRYSSSCPLTVSFTGGGGSGATAVAYLKSGHYNTAVGYYALFANSNGNNNTAVGYQAGYAGTPGSDANTYKDSLMTFIGSNAARSSTISREIKLVNATAIGANATVATNNSLVLGSINGVNGATSNTFVGIGTASPLYKLHVNGRITADSGFLSTNTSGVALNAALSNVNAAPFAVFARNSSSGNVAVSGMRLVSNDGVNTGDVVWQNTASTSYISQGNGLLFISTGVGGIKSIVANGNSIKFGFNSPAASTNNIEFYRDSLIAKNIERAVTYNAILGYDTTTIIGGAPSEGHVKYIAMQIAGTTYTPTATNGANVDASTPFSVHYTRVGSTVTFSGTIDIDETAAAGNTVVELSLPFASNFSGTTDASGWVTPTNAGQFGGYIKANIANDRLELEFLGISTGTVTYKFGGHYTIK